MNGTLACGLAFFVSGYCECRAGHDPGEIRGIGARSPAGAIRTPMFRNDDQIGGRPFGVVADCRDGIARQFDDGDASSSRIDGVDELPEARLDGSFGERPSNRRQGCQPPAPHQQDMNLRLIPTSDCERLGKGGPATWRKREWAQDQ